MNEELAQLALAAATALVSAMGTDLWQDAKRLMRGILEHGEHLEHGRGQELAAALDQSSGAIGPAHVAGLAEDTAGTAGLVTYWSDALARLLEQNPDLAVPVRALVSLGIQERPGSPVQVNSATNSGQVYAVQNGTQHIVSAPQSRRGPEADPRVNP